MTGAEATLEVLVGWLRLAAEAISVLIIGIGVVVTVWDGVRTRTKTGRDVYQATRVRLGHYLVLALEFQLASDILTTAMAPSWQELGRLAAIAAIRTFLNFFLLKEQEEIERGGKAAPSVE